VLTLTEIKRLAREYDFQPNKRLGQNFLIDRNICASIIRAAGISRNDVVLEIGAGLGNITLDLAGAAKEVLAVEFDKRLCAILKDTLPSGGNIRLFCQDILKFDFKAHVRENRLRIIANMPYYITTPILEQIIENKEFIKDALLMVQKEVGERMLAKSASKVYSPISCYVQYNMKATRVAVVKKTSFFPQPEVDSVLILLEVRQMPLVKVKDEALLFKIIRGTFSQRRKMISSSLSHKNVLGLDKERIREMLSRAGVSANKRPEMISLEDFARITDAIAG
jgi:16S rRNA (adenine1518-N6/adenine1519-N6)-dimethyltransferase